MKSNVSTYIILVFCFAHASLMAQTETISLSHTVGEVAYESKDHRSNVYEVVSDKKALIDNQFQGIIIAGTDYYPYGSEIGARSFSGDYKYGFQGQEKDEEVKGKGNSFNYKYRMHDARVGRFFAVDPLTIKYPHYSSYQFSGNKTTAYVELEGLEEFKPQKLKPNVDYTLKTDATANVILKPSNEVIIKTQKESTFWNSVSNFLTRLDKFVVADGGGGYTLTNNSTNNSSNAAGRKGNPSAQIDVTDLMNVLTLYGKSLSRPTAEIKNSKDFYEFAKEVEEYITDIAEESGYEPLGNEDLIRNLRDKINEVEKKYLAEEKNEQVDPEILQNSNSVKGKFERVEFIIFPNEYYKEKWSDGTDSYFKYYKSSNNSNGDLTEVDEIEFKSNTEKYIKQ